MTAPRTTPAAMVVTLTVAQLRELVVDAVADALADLDLGAAPPPALLDRAALARELSVSCRTLDRLRESGMPAEIRIGDSPRWPREAIGEIVAWLRAREAA